MRHTFFRESYVRLDHALQAAEKLVDEMTGHTNPAFHIDEGDAGWCIYHSSRMTAFTGMTMEMRVVIYLEEAHRLVVEGFLTRD